MTGLSPAGPELRQKPPITLRGEPGVDITAPLSVTEMGFSLHAATTASADDTRGRDALVRYALRPPIAQERLHILPDNLVRIELKRPFRDGTVAIDLDPISLLCRLAASVPPPGCHLVHSPTHRSRHRPWAELLKRTFQIDVERCECGGRFKLRALVIEAHNIERLLRYLGEPLEPPKRAPARDPPYFKSQVLRRKFGELN